MRTLTTIDSAATIAVEAENLVASGEAEANQATIEGYANTFFLSLLHSAAIDMVNRKECHLAFATTGTLKSTIIVQHFSLDQLALMFHGRENGVAVLCMPHTAVRPSSLDVLMIVGASTLSIFGGILIIMRFGDGLRLIWVSLLPVVYTFTSTSALTLSVLRVCRSAFSLRSIQAITVFLMITPHRLSVSHPYKLAIHADRLAHGRRKVN